MSDALQKLVETTMPYGKYKGTLIADLPGNYLNWMAREGFPPGSLGRLLALMHEIDHNGLKHLLAPLKNMKKPAATDSPPASGLIDKKIAELSDWRGETLRRMRKLITEADPDVVEEWKWMGTPVWSHDGILCTGESYKSVVKLTFLKGASLPDPARLFNASLDGNARRAIDIREGEEVDAEAFKALIRAAIALNTSSRKAR